MAKETKPIVVKETKPIVEEGEGSGYVSVKKEDLDALFAKFDKQSEDIKLLYRVADKSRLDNNEKRGEPLIRTCKVSTIDGKILLAWKLTKNTSEIINGRWMEEQKIEVFFEDGGNKELQLLDFYRNVTKISDVEILSRSSSLNDKNEEESIFKLQLPDGKVLEINSKYIN